MSTLQKQGSGLDVILHPNSPRASAQKPPAPEVNAKIDKGECEAIVDSKPFKSTDSKALALGGYDVTSYYAPSEPGEELDVVKVGRTDEGYTVVIESIIQGLIEYRFASQHAASKFKENYDIFRPQYGGFCAFSVATGDTKKPDGSTIKGHMVSSDPLVFTVHDSKLYLFGSTDAKQLFDADPAFMAVEANKNWLDLCEYHVSKSIADEVQPKPRSPTTPAEKKARISDEDE